MRFRETLVHALDGIQALEKADAPWTPALLPLRLLWRLLPHDLFAPTPMPRAGMPVNVVAHVPGPDGDAGACRQRCRRLLFLASWHTVGIKDLAMASEAAQVKGTVG
jgi:hypothetical protein